MKNHFIPGTLYYKNVVARQTLATKILSREIEMDWRGGCDNCGGQKACLISFSKPGMEDHYCLDCLYQEILESQRTE